jgi:hypothetical protein
MKLRILSAICVLLFSIAQNPTRGTVHGVITGPDGILLPGVRVVARRQGAAIAGHTGPDGAYELSMPPRVYELRAELDGFCGGGPHRIQLTAGEPLQLDMRLWLAPVEEVQRVTYSLPEAVERTDAIVHLRIARSHPPRLLIPDIGCGDGNVLMEHEANVIAEVKTDTGLWPNARRVRFMQRRAGIHSDGTTTVTGPEDPYVIGEEYVAFLNWSMEDAYLEPHWNPSYMVPVSAGEIRWGGRLQIPGVAGGMSLEGFLGSLRALTGHEGVGDRIRYHGPDDGH